MTLHPRTLAILEELDRPDWFLAVGVRDTENALVLSSWNEAIESCDTIEWVNLRIEMRSQVSRPVEKKDRPGAVSAVERGCARD